jgi:photoactive yellow protein
MTNTTSDIYGLYELDTSGKVMYSKINSGDYLANKPNNVVGRNFFDEVAPFKNVEEFRQRFRYFAQSSESAQKFNFTCQFEEKPVEVKVMLTHICEREFDASSKLIIVDIRKA